MSALAVLDRTIGDTADRESWADLHRDVIGSYWASHFARPDSVETYVRQMLTPKTFNGSAATKSGTRWEPMLLAWAGAEPNSLFIGHPDIDGFGATVDGTHTRDLFEGGPIRFGIVETKAKHNLIVTGPKPAEIRQMAWQLYCIPEADGVQFVWGELVRDHRGEWDLRKGNPKSRFYPREHPDIVAATALIVPIAFQVRAALREARRLQEAWA